MNVRGVEIELHETGEALSEAIKRDHDFFEFEILDFIRDNYPIQRTIIDVGANIGNHALFFANFLQFYEYIICFEPVPDNFDLLVRNLNGYKGVKLYNHALSDKTQIVRMSVNRGNMGASRVAIDGELEIQAHSLDRLYYQNVSMIKIDVEEYEPEVLDGAQDTIARCHPLLVIEDWNGVYFNLIPANYQCVFKSEPSRTYIYEWKE